MRDFWDDRTFEQDIDSCVGCEDYVDGECVGGREYERKCMMINIARMTSELKKVLAEKLSKQKEG